MIYRVVIDNIDVYGEEENLALLNPSLTVELNSAGSLEFIMPPNHLYYATLPQYLTSNIEVYENNELIWFGRVTEIEKTLSKNKKFYCEGALAYFNDSYLSPHKWDQVQVNVLVHYILEKHNLLVGPSRQFQFGQGLGSLTGLFLTKREINYEKTFDVMKNIFADDIPKFSYFLRRENGINYLDYYAPSPSDNPVPYNNTQPIQYELNITDLVEKQIRDNLVTSIVPLATYKNNVINISSINHGLEYLDTDMVQQYGRIIEIVDFGTLDDSVIDAPLAVKTLGERWIQQNLVSNFNIEITTIDLHHIVSQFNINNASSLSDIFPIFKVGQMVHCVSNVHGIDTNLPITKVSINLDTGNKSLVIGTPKQERLSGQDFAKKHGYSTR